MKKMIFSSVLAALATQAGAEDITASQVLGLLGAADGSARVLMAGDVDMNLLEGVLTSLAAAPARAVRFGVADTVPNRDEVLGRIREVGIETWGICDLWLTKAGTPTEYAYNSAIGMLAENADSLVVLDNGENDEDRYNSQGEDPNLGRKENPIIFGFLATETNSGVLDDPVQYEATWNFFTSDFPLDMNAGGCR